MRWNSLYSSSQVYIACAIENNIINPISVNLAVTLKCNYNCRFCFGKFKTLNEKIDTSRILDIPQLLSDAGCQKLTFEGGEPLLSPKILELVYNAKESGMTTSLITNGSLLTFEILEKLSNGLDWLGLSVDSACEKTEKLLGRGFGNHVEHVKKVARWTHSLGIGLKINSVITKLNYKEDLTEFIKILRPKRFKAFQILKIRGENDCSYNDLGISTHEFDIFVKKHRKLIKYGIQFRTESEDDMMGSYIMLLPDGRFFSNFNGVHHYGKKNIFENGVSKAFKEVGWDYLKFLKRGGLYNWNIEKR